MGVFNYLPLGVRAGFPCLQAGEHKNCLPPLNLIEALSLI